MEAAAVDRSVERPHALLDFVSATLGGEDPILRRIREDIRRQDLPPINVGPDEGRLLHLLASSCGARKIVEIGTLAGYSGAWLARALPADGVLDTIEREPRHAAVARANFARAGLSARVRVHEGPASAVLPTLELRAPFDLCFIDADKEGYPSYVRWAARNLRSGGVVVCDNAYAFGQIHREDLPVSDAARAKAMRECLRLLADASLFASCAMIPTGEGMAVAVRR